MSDAQVLPFRWRPELTFNDRLRLVRTNYGRRLGKKITQEKMAELLDEKPGTYKSWEATGRPEDPVAFAKKVEEITGADPVWLLDLTDGPDPGRDGGRTLSGPAAAEYAPRDSNPEPADSPVVVPLHARPAPTRHVGPAAA